MAWILILAGILILLSARLLPGRRQKRTAFPAPMTDASVAAHMKQAAAGCEVRGVVKPESAASERRRFQKAAARLNALHRESLTPDARLICENAHLLAEEPSFPKTAKLPRARTGEARLTVFAKELLACTACTLNRENLSSALEAWADVSPLTEGELAALPHSLYDALSGFLCRCAQSCLQYQRSARDARRAHLLQKYGKTRSAQKILRRSAKSPAFWAALFELEKPDAWMGHAFTRFCRQPEELTAEMQKHQSERRDRLENAFLSLQAFSELPWRELHNRYSPFQRIFVQEEGYRRMDEESQALYRRKASAIAQMCKTTETAVAAAVLALCRQHFGRELYRHCGYYLVDEGFGDLLAQLHCLTPLRRLRMAFRARRHSCRAAFLWLAFLAMLCGGFALGYAMLMLPLLAAVFTLALSQAMEAAARAKQLRTPLPRIRPEMITQQERMLVVCCAVLSTAEHAQRVIRDLSRLQESLSDLQPDFLLMADFPDSLTLTSSDDSVIASAVSSAIRTLRQTTGGRILYLQRERMRIPGEETCHGRDRQRGALETVLRLIRDREIQDRFAYASFEPAELMGRYRFVAAMDENILFTGDALLRMAGALLHPLNRRQRLDGRFRGISLIKPALQPVSHEFGTCFAKWLYSPGAAYGNEQLIGLIDPEPFLSAIVPLPRWGILHSAAVDEAMAGCKTDAVWQYHPTQNTLVHTLKAIHRRTRGLWQLFPLLFPLPGQPLSGRSGAAERATIRRRALQTLAGPLRLLVMLYAALTGRQTLLLLAFLLPAIAEGLPLSSPGAVRSLLLRQMILPCTAFVQADAFGRAVYRLLISRKKWMEHTPARQMSSAARHRSMLLFGVNMSSAGVFAFLAVYQRLWVALLPAAFWAAMVFVLPYMEQRSPRNRTEKSRNPQ